MSWKSFEIGKSFIIKGLDVGPIIRRGGRLKKKFNLGFCIVLFRIYRAVFYPPLIMGPPNSFILKLFPVPNLF